MDSEDQTTINEVFNPINPDEGVINAIDPLALDIPDEELVKVVDRDQKERKKFWTNNYNLFERRTKLEEALFGRQIQQKEKDKELKKYEARYSNNALYEIEASIKPVAMSRLPDLIVTPGNKTKEAKDSADDISKAVDDDLKKRQNRQVLGLAFKHLPIFFTGIIKTRWNPELGKDGDYEYVNVHPDNIMIDYTASTASADDMRTIPETVSLTVQEVIMRFPSKKKELFDALKKEGLALGEDDFTWKDLASPIKILEVWFTWYKKGETGELSTTPNTERGIKWEKVEGVLWKYKDVILKKMKNPNFDYKGDEQVFTYDDPSQENSKRSLLPEEVQMASITGMLPPNTQTEQTYHNYFKMPKKPYFFMGYDQWGKVPLDETSRIEQNYYNQESLNEQGKQIINTLKARVKHIWSTDGGLNAEDVQNADMENPKLDMLVDGNVNEVHASVTPERPDQAQFTALQQTKDGMFGLAGATSLTGQLQTDVATSNQIAREQNFTRADDLVEDTINAASEWMASWALQFIKLRYTQDHFRKLLGAKGSITFLKLNRDKIDDGMEVMIKASGTDKIKAQNNAMDMAKLGPPYSDPVSFFTDMGMSDPEGRAEKGMLLASAPELYIQKFIMGNDTTGSMIDALNGQGAAQAAGGPMTPPPPPEGQPPQQPTPTDTTQVASQPPTGAPAASPQNGVL